MSAIAMRIQQLSMSVRTRLPLLISPTNDEHDAERHKDELMELSRRVRLLIRDLKSQEHLIQLQMRNKTSDPWSMKQKLLDVKLDKHGAEELMRLIEDALRPRGFNAMQVGHKLHELIENSGIRSEEAEHAFAQLRPTHSTIGPATTHTASHVAIGHMLDSAVPPVILSYLFLQWAANKVAKMKSKHVA